MEPMLATLAEAPLVDPNLVYEPKYDGIRALVSVTPRRGAVDVTIASRKGNDKSKQFPEVVEALARWGKGRPVAFVAFDLLRDGVDDLAELPLAARRVRLEAALAGGLDSTLRLARQERGDGRALLEEARARGWEGIVAKDARSTYKAGRRTLDWRKLKLVKRQELVIGGFTEAKGARSHFGALLVGLPTESGKLRYAGHVGGGFTDKELAHVGRLLAARKAATSPFDGPLPAANGKPHFVRPELVAEVQFAE